MPWSDFESPSARESIDDRSWAPLIAAFLLAGGVVVAFASGFRHPFELIVLAASLLMAGATLRFEEAIRGTFATSVGQPARIVGACAISFGLVGELVSLDSHHHLLPGAFMLVVVGVLARLEGAMVERRRP